MQKLQLPHSNPTWNKIGMQNFKNQVIYYAVSDMSQDSCFIRRILGLSTMYWLTRVVRYMLHDYRHTSNMTCSASWSDNLDHIIVDPELYDTLEV